MSAVNVLITGANTGLGYETVKSLLKSSKQSYNIFLGSRSRERGEDAASKLKADVDDTKSQITVVEIDIQDDASIAKCIETVSSKTDRVDVLINNAGGGFDMDLLKGKMSPREAWNKAYDLNVTSAHLFTQAVMPLLFKSADPRVIFLASGTASIAEAAQGLPYTAVKPPAGWPKPTPHWSFSSYRTSKAGMNMMMVDWLRELTHDRVKMWAVSPGFLATNLAGADPAQLRKMGAKEPHEGADFVRDVVEGKRDNDVGKAIRVNDVQPW